MFGTAPQFIASTYEVTRSRIIWPFSFIPFIIFGFTLLSTFLLNYVTWSMNSGRSSSSYFSVKCCNSSSFVKGRTITQQSLSLNIDLITFLILFLLSTYSENPFWVWRAFSKYSLGEIFSSSLSTSFKLKSLTTHINVGKYFDNSSGSISSWIPLDLNWMCLVKLTTKLMFYKACSSIDPTELYTKQEAINTAREKIQTSWLSS